MRKRLCVTVNPYSADMQVMDRSKSERIVDKGFYSPYCTAENYPFTPAQILVDAANKKPNHLNQLTAFKKFTQSGQNLSISCHKVSELNRSTISWALALTRENMHTLYEQSEWGWSEKVKLEELTNRKAWYLIVRTAEGHNLAFVHFRFDLDYGIEVLYCYEIQLDKSIRRVGLGQYLMLILELIAKQNQMKKVMLTVFKHNIAGRNFFAKKLRYEVDETSPTCRRTSYEILSKKIIYQSRSKHLSRQAASSCLRIRMPYSLDRSNQSSVESISESKQMDVPKIKATFSHATNNNEQTAPQFVTLSQPNLEFGEKSDQTIYVEPSSSETNDNLVERSSTEPSLDEKFISSELLEPNLSNLSNEKLLEPSLEQFVEFSNKNEEMESEEKLEQFVEFSNKNEEIESEEKLEQFVEFSNKNEEIESEEKLEQFVEFSNKNEEIESKEKLEQFV